jgi:hypothetical protein
MNALAPGRRRGIVAAQTQAQKEVKEAVSQPPPKPKRIKGKMSLK